MPQRFDIKDALLDVREGLFNYLCNQSVWLLKRLIEHDLGDDFTLQQIISRFHHTKRRLRLNYKRNHILWLLAHNIIVEIPDKKGHYKIASYKIAREVIFKIEAIWVCKQLSQINSLFPFSRNSIASQVLRSTEEDPDDLHLFKPTTSHIDLLVEWHILSPICKEDFCDHEAFGFSRQALKMLGCSKKHPMQLVVEDVSNRLDNIPFVYLR